jgi:hypothetical protein
VAFLFGATVKRAENPPVRLASANTSSATRKDCAGICPAGSLLRRSLAPPRDRLRLNLEFFWLTLVAHDNPLVSDILGSGISRVYGALHCTDLQLANFQLIEMTLDLPHLQYCHAFLTLICCRFAS